MNDLSHQDMILSLQDVFEHPAARLRILFWHWGRGGAGSKFTFELVRAAHQSGECHCYVSAVKDCELACLIRAFDPHLPLNEISTFKGDKSTFTGKLAALYGLTGLREIGADFTGFIARHQIDLVICTMPAIWDQAALSAIRTLDIPFVMMVHDAVPHPGDGYPFRRLTMNREIAAADGLITLSDHVKQHLVSRHPKHKDAVWTVPHGAFDFGVAQQRHLNLGEPIRLLFLGRILAYKGLDLLLDACHLLQARNIPFTLEIMGSGDMTPYAQQVAGLPTLGLINAWVDEADIAEALARNDVMMLPYREASQSGVAASAASAGMPAIATPVGGLNEQITDGENGLVTKAVSPEAIADSILAFLDDPALYARCSEGALMHARTLLGWGPIARRINAIARDVFSRKLIADYE
jgi:glycosyltransferase involved in cell wall biosynthesis